MPRHGSLRASDADRDAVIERLRQAATEGRIASHELDDRVSRALRALTYADLDAVVADLPRPGRERHAGRRGAGVRPTVGGWAVATARANPFLLVCMIPVVIAAGAMLLALSITWLTLMAVATILTGGHHHHRLSRRQNPWALMWGAGPARRDWI